MQEFLLPDPGEGLTEAEIVRWRVQPGDTVRVNDVLLEVETAKSIVDLPSPFAGVVAALLVEEGQTVEVGSPIIRIAEADAQGRPASPAAASAVADAESAADAEGGAVLVGYGVRAGTQTRRKGRPAGAAPGAAAPTSAAPAAPTQAPPASGRALAKPPTRKLAKELGVDLSTLTPSGAGGVVTRDDVMRAVEPSAAGGSTAEQAPTRAPTQAPTRAPWTGGREERIPVKGVRKATAQGMVASAFTAPHVSVFREIDASRTMEYVARLKASNDFESVKVSPLLVVAKAVLWALRRNPEINSSFTDTELIVRHDVNLGIAAATPRGLLVPNIKAAQELSLLDLARAIEQLTITAREGRTQPADMQHGTFTITNIGVFGMDSGTPILNPGETGILAFGAIRQKAWVVDGEIRPRWVTTVGGSFDHRAVDGDTISRFVADVASILEEPALLLD